MICLKPFMIPVTNVACSQLPSCQGNPSCVCYVSSIHPLQLSLDEPTKSCPASLKFCMWFSRKLRVQTPPKTNMEHENTSLEKEKHRPKPPIFGVQNVSFSGCPSYLAPHSEKRYLNISHFPYVHFSSKTNQKNRAINRFLI